MARKHHSARGQQKQLKGDEGATRIQGKASRGFGKDLHRRAEGDLRKVPRLLERIYEPRRSSHLRIRLQVRNADSNRNLVRIKMKTHHGRYL